MSIRIVAAVWLIALLTPWASVCLAQSHTLRIESTSKDPPRVQIGDTVNLPVEDPTTGKWMVPIDQNPPNFVTSYLIDSTDGSVVAIKLSIPGRIVGANQLVYLVPPSIQTVDEVNVRGLWESADLVELSSDPRTQFRYLQDLVYVNTELKKRSEGSPRLDATTLRAAFLLFRVVDNLARNTWYVIDKKTQGIIDYARDILVRGQSQKRDCRWLGKATCTGLSALIASVQNLNAQRFTRMYGQLVPEGTRLTLEACGGGLPKDLRAFVKFLHDVNDSDGAPNMERRVLNDIATCEVRMALCDAQSPEAAIAQLDATIALLEPYQAIVRQRFVEVERLRRDVASGKPAVCPP